MTKLKFQQNVFFIPEALMDPQSRHTSLGIMEIFVRSQQSLEHLGDIPKVEQIVNLGRSWQEFLYNGLVDLKGSFGHDIAHWFDVFFKVL